MGRKLRRFQVIVATVICLSLITGSFSTYAQSNTDSNITSGTYGENVGWSYNQDTATLTVTGEGEMATTWSGSQTPWYYLANELKHIVIKDGITSIPRYVFEYQTNVETVQLPKTLEILAGSAFNDCEKLNNLLIPYSVKEFISEFSRCGSLADVYYEGSEEEWLSIAGVENIKGSFGGPKFNFHYLEYHEKLDSTCTEDGYEAYYSFGEDSIYTHVYDLDKQILESPKVIAATGHSDGDWIINTKATCTSTGSKYKTCTICDDLVTEEIPALGHEFKLRMRQEPTCTEQGYKEYICNRCWDENATYREKIPEIGHNYNKSVITTAPTTTTEGIKRYICSECGGIKEESIPVLEKETYNDEVHIGSSFEFEISSSLSQTYTITCREDVDFTSTLTGTSTVMTAQGVTYNKTYTIKVDEPGSYLFYIKGNLSSNVLSYKVNITDHVYSTKTYNPTCITKGYTLYTCNICGHSFKDNYMGTIDHEWDNDYTIDVEATCEKNPYIVLNVIV